MNKEIQDIIKAKAFDANSRFLEVTLVHDNGTPVNLTGHIVRFNAIKADGTYIFNNCQITDATAGIFLLELTDQTLAIGDSIITADISVYTQDEKTVLTTRTFRIKVQSTVRNDAAVESSNEYNSVVTLFQDVWDMRETVRNINERFGQLTDDLSSGDTQAGSSALGALNKIWNYLRVQSTAAIVDTVNTISSTLNIVNTRVGSSSLATSVMKFLEMIYNRGGGIKSIQRGVSNQLGSTSGFEQVDLTISSININKSIIIINGWGPVGVNTSWSTHTSPPPGGYILDSTTIRLTSTRPVNSRLDNAWISWQVIEFY